MEWLNDLTRFAMSGFWNFVGTVIIVSLVASAVLAALHEVAMVFRSRRSDRD